MSHRAIHKVRDWERAWLDRMMREIIHTSCHCKLQLIMTARRIMNPERQYCDWQNDIKWIKCCWWATTVLIRSLWSSSISQGKCKENILIETTNVSSSILPGSTSYHLNWLYIIVTVYLWSTYISYVAVNSIIANGEWRKAELIRFKELI